jgi:chaperonin cofactor prefoldin
MSKENPFNRVVPIGAARDIRIEKAKKDGNFEAVDREEVAKFLDQLAQSRSYDLTLVTLAMQKVNELDDTAKLFLGWGEITKEEEYKELRKQLISALETYEKKI